MTELARSPWPYRAARTLLVVIGLHAALLSLQLLGVATLAPRLLRLEPVDESAGAIRVTGRTLPITAVELGTDERPLSAVMSGLDGRFESMLELPQGATSFWARALWPTTGRVLARAEAPIRRATIATPAGEQAPGTTPPVLSIAFYIKDLHLLWIAGEAPPLQSVLVESEAGTLVARGDADRTGAFDMLVPIAASPPTHLRARIDGRDRLTAPPVTVAPVTTSEVPLKRGLTVEMEARRTSLRWEITLPTAHPRFRALIQGRQSSDVFVHAVFAQPPVPFFSAYTAAPAFGIDGAAGMVTIEQSLPGPLSDFRLFPSPSGLGSMPLLSSRDWVIVESRDIGRLSFDGPLPTRLTSKRAEWRGPIRAGQAVAVRASASAFDIADRLRREARPQTDRLQDFLGEFERRTAGDVVARTWRLLLGLIPYAGLLWLWWRKPFGNAAAWGALAGVSLLVVVWRSWPYVEWLMASGAARWLHAILGSLLFSGGQAPPSSAVLDAIRDSSANAAWLVFVLILPLVTYHFSAFTSASFAPGPPSTWWSRLRQRAGRVYVVYAGILAIVLTLAGSQIGFLMYTIENALRGRLGPSARVLEDLMSVGLVALVALVLISLGLRSGLCGLALLGLAVHSAVTRPSFESLLSQGPFSDLAPLKAIPGWMPVAIVLITAYPLLLRLVHPLTPGDRRWLRRLLTATVMITAFLHFHLPVEGLLLAGGVTVLVTAAWVTVRGLGHLTLAAPLSDWSHGRPRIFLLGLVAIALVVAWPISHPEYELRFSHIARLVSTIGELLFYVPAAGVVLLLLQEARRLPSAVPARATVVVGIYLFAVFLVNSWVTWLFLPLPLIVGWFLATFWLFRPQGDVEALGPSAGTAEAERPKLLRAFFDSSAARDQLDAIDKALDKQLEGAQLTPEQYEEKRNIYRRYFAGRLATDDGRVTAGLREAAFAVGHGSVTTNVATAVGWGTALAAVPFLVALYQYLPSGQIQYPYPAAELLRFLIQAAAGWLLYAFFFGYFFTNLRGHTGLAKGVNLFLALAVPLAIWRLLSAQSFDDLRPFLLWTSQLFLFCSLLGLIGFDYSTLRRHGGRVGDLTAVHKLPALSVYGSSLIAAVVPAVIALFTGRVKDLVAFFLNELLPRVPSAGP
jgi:hypothetical protein